MANKKKQPSVGLRGDKEILKKYPNAGLATQIVLDPEEVIWLPSKSYSINYQLGGGIPYGCILEIYGGESSGKTILSLDFVEVAQRLGGVALFVDAEQAFTQDWALKNGLDLNKTYIFNETAVEKISDWVADMCIHLRGQLTNNEPIILVIDSTAALECLKNINTRQEDKKAEMGNRAKAIGDMLRLRNELLFKLGIVTIFINQLRLKLSVGMFEDPETTPGGQALKFFAKQRLGVYQKKMITSGSKPNVEWHGNAVSVRVKKNKVAPPKPTITLDVIFDAEYDTVGFARYQGLDTILLKLGVVEKRGNSYFYKEERLAKSKGEFAELITEDETLLRKLVRRSSINSFAKTRRRLKNIGENLFPLSSIDMGSIKSQVKEAEEDDDE